MSTPRRNEPCPCGSGKKYKKCHGSFSANSEQARPPEVWQGIEERLKAREAQREKQQGLGRPIISTAMGDTRFVAVGKNVQYAKNWKTFHDFLRHFFLDTLGRGWLKAQAALPPEQQHIVLRWHDSAMQNLSQEGKRVGEVQPAPMTGAARAFLNLAYNIYLIAHHGADPDIVASYIARLKSARSDDVTGAIFETYAAAAFLKAGFSIEYEKERGVAKSHVEFVATNLKSRAKFSVEVKARERSAAAAAEADPEVDDVKRLRVGNKLNKALGKEAKHTRVILIEINIPDVLDPSVDHRRDMTGWPVEALEQIRYQEKVLFRSGQEKPSAYVIVTNHAFHNNLDAPDVAYQAFSTGFKIPDFCPDEPFNGYYAALQARERHSDIFALLESLTTHYEIPSTFDGELPEFAFGEQSTPRLLFNRWYMVPIHDGRQVAGRLEEATIDEAQHQVIGVYQLETGEHILVRSPISEKELAAYRRAPETFFGQIRPVSKPVQTIEDLCDFFYQNHRKLSKSQLLTDLRGHTEFERLKTAEQKELAALWAEACALRAFNLPRPTDS
jgi:SEC-C motif